ncbi:MAG: sensor histidine kinase [Cellulomonadaceae bacterium]
MDAAPPARHPSGARRRFRTLNLTAVLPLLVVVGVVLVALQARTWIDALVLGTGLLVIVVAYERWTVGEITRVAIPCLAVAAIIWPYGLLVIGGQVQASYFALLVVGSLTVPQLPRHPGAAAVALVAYVAAVGLVGVFATPGADVGRLLTLVVFPAGVTAIVTGLMFPNKGFYDVVDELEEAREREGELAVASERMRFASDLHDIQGHTLHVVKLKIALARKVLHTDPARAEQELDETYALVGDTIAQTKELAYGRRRLNLTAELENARNLLDAAGIQVRIDRREPVAQPVELVAQVLRETTTNILRHSRARLVRVELSEQGIAVVNDGVVDDGPPELQGLAALARRVADAGGELTARCEGGHFRTAAMFPAHAEPTSGTEGGT